MAGEEERRALARVTVKGKVRVRPAGEGGGGRLCRVRDANADGVRLIVEALEGLDDDGLDKIEVLTVGRVRRAKLYYLRNLQGKAARIREKRQA